MEKKIKNKALTLGYEKCGIIPVELMNSYQEKLKQRIEHFPESEYFYRRLPQLFDPLAKYPWAKSIVILASDYSIYNIPDAVKHKIATAYLFDPRVKSNSAEYLRHTAMEHYLTSLGLTAASEIHGVTGLRWAAHLAGLGVIRRNNFFYTESGSWLYLDAWMIDKELELIDKPALPQCPENCTRCIDACPTGSLSAPYTLSPASCISFITTLGSHALADDPLSSKLGSCIYGCDLCQNACPMNAGKWKGHVSYPGLEALIPLLDPEELLNLSEECYREKIQPQFFYLSPDELWKWKVNVLCFMKNNYRPQYKPLIVKACLEEHKKVREMALSAFDACILKNVSQHSTPY